MTGVKEVALLGGGVIGGGWAARLAMNGIDSVVYDPDPDAERKLEEVMANARRAYRKLSLAPLHEGGKVRFVDSIAEAVANADFIQENAPEKLALKVSLLAEASRVAKPDAIIASSTSGFKPTDLQVDCTHPERVCIGHPFNPVYLLPLVEVVGGEKTSEDCKQKAGAFYETIGMHALQIDREADGHVSDRLQEALWREALHIVNDGIATADQVDRSICYGPGLRWSFMGPALTFRLAGGEGGLAHYLRQFGPTLKSPWTKLVAPEMTEDLVTRLTEQSDAQANGVSIRDLERLRDDCLVSVLQALRSNDYAAGRTQRVYEERLYEASHQTVFSESDDLSKPLRLHEARVAPEWVDYNGHLTESRYLQIFGDSSDALYRYLGVDAGYHAAGLSYYTIETHINHLLEVAAEEPLYVTTQILDHDEKRIHLFHSMHHAGDDSQLATAEMMILHVDTNAQKSCPAKPEVFGRLSRVAAAHQSLEKPELAGRQIGIRRKA